MSFREMKVFTEQLRSLGCSHTVSIESFRTPNFELMAKILYWLIRNYDPSFETSEEIDTETKRVQFIKTVATFIAPKSHLRLNTRNLYKADGYAVKELLKITGLLTKAKEVPIIDVSKLVAFLIELHILSYGIICPLLTFYTIDGMSLPPLDISNKLSKLKTCRTLATTITEKGAELFDLLGRELELREIRTNVISRPFELMTMETAVTDAINKLNEKLSITQVSFENLQADESNLNSKIEKKKAEFERAEKRLKSLQGVRPAYMDEYEKIEVDLIKVYEQYIEKFRNLTFLEQQLDEYNREEQDKFEETESSLKRMQNRLREEELELLRGENDSNRNSRPSRPAAAGSRGRGINRVARDEESDEEEFEEDAVSLDSDVSSGELAEEDLGSAVTTEVHTRPKGAGANQRGNGHRDDDEEDDDDEDSSVDMGDGDDDYF
ncbi:Clusterin-associated protein-1-domain-containing protein [Globomyces pollinis-pini]|nr:Clusterin-associated protein-1-domain-containing protein [Globomyces pollinis-pini]